MLAKYIVLSNIIGVLSNNQEPLLILKKFIVLLDTLSAYNSLLVHYKVHSSDLIWSQGMFVYKLKV